MVIKMSKYHSKKVMYNGEVFDSKKEWRRYCDLLIMQRAGEISDLKRQVEFELIPTQREPDIIGTRGGIKKKGKVIELKCSYIADFTYMQDGKLVVEDTKGMKTRDYIIKRKLMLYLKGIQIKEV